MQATTKSVALIGPTGAPNDISATITRHPGHDRRGPEFHGVGHEQRDRIRAAVRNSGFAWPDGHVSVTSSHHDTASDLAIAIAVLAAAGTVAHTRLDSTVLLGELGLNGSIRSLVHLHPRALDALDDSRITTIVLPHRAQADSVLHVGARFIAAGTLSEVVTWLNSDAATHPDDEFAVGDPELAETGLSAHALRAIQIAAAGHHPLLITARRGSAATLVARLVRAMLPDLTADLSVEITALHVAARARHAPGWVLTAPFIAPRPASSLAELVGGGTPIGHSGAVGLAHGGVLYLENLAMFSRDHQRSILAALTTAPNRFGLPLSPLVVMALRPCPCDAASDTACRCSVTDHTTYRARVVAPLRDWAELSLSLQTRDAEDEHLLVTSAQARASVLDARKRAQARQSATQSPPQRQESRRDAASAGSRTSLGIGLLGWLRITTALTARDAERCLRLARTVADLDDADTVSDGHITTALGFLNRPSTNRW